MSMHLHGVKIRQDVNVGESVTFRFLNLFAKLIHTALKRSLPLSVSYGTCLIVARMAYPMLESCAPLKPWTKRRNAGVDLLQR